MCPGSGGWDEPNAPAATKECLPTIQLYNMHDDVGEKVNVQSQDPEVGKSLTTVLEKSVADGRRTPGAPEKNDVTVDSWKKQHNEAAPAKKSRRKAKPLSSKAK